MRFPSEYTCGLLNVARHAAFGKEAATMVVDSFSGEWLKVCSILVINLIPTHVSIYLEKLSFLFSKMLV